MLRIVLKLIIRSNGMGKMYGLHIRGIGKDLKKV